MPKPKRLSSLGLYPENGNDPLINEIIFDSRRVKPGCLFAALKGVSVHGAKFVEAALEAGADDRAADLVFAECAKRRVQKAKAVTADRDVTWAPYYDPSKPPRRRFGVSPLLVGALGVVAKLRFGL